MLQRLYEMYLYTVLGYESGVSPEAFDYLGISYILAVITLVVIVILGIKFCVWLIMIPIKQVL